MGRVFQDLRTNGLCLSFKQGTRTSVFFGNGYEDTQGLRWWMLESWLCDRSKIVIFEVSARKLESYGTDHYTLFKEVPIHGNPETGSLQSWSS